VGKEQVSFAAAEAGGKGARILDIGCGTGEMDRALWKRGCRVVGIDANERMIEEAQENLRVDGYREKHSRTAPRFMVMDMRKIGEQIEEGAFDAVLCLGNTLVHLSSPEEMSGFLGETAKVLKSGGRLVVQILNYDYILDEHVTRLPLIETAGHRFHRTYDLESGDGLVSFHGILEEKGSGMRIESVTRLYPLRTWQLKELLEERGFALYGEYGSYSYGPAGGKRLPYIITARKP
jgi:SAM-dependent methyltransferase